jgi:DNA-binding CsgD family transcriptional regulator
MAGVVEEVPGRIRAVYKALRFRVVVIQAAAGWGKTTTVREALATTAHRWISASDLPAESGRLIYGLASAYELSAEPLGRILSAARSAQSAQPLVEWLRAFGGHDSGLTVIDDLHELDGDALSLDLLKSLIEHAHLRCILVSRRNVGLPLSTWLAYGIAGSAIVEEQLALQPAEATHLLATSGESDRGWLEQTVTLAAGWPIALRFFIHGHDQSPDIAKATQIGREAAFDFFAEHAMDAVPTALAAPLRSLAFVGQCDSDLSEALGIQSDSLRWLRSSSLPLQERAGTIRLHDLFADFIRRRMTQDESREAASFACRALTQLDRSDRALDIARMHAKGELPDLLRRFGLTLLENGRVESLRQALDQIDPMVRNSDFAILGLSAAVHSSLGAFEKAEELFRRAIAVAPAGSPRMRIAAKFTMMLANRGRHDAHTVLYPFLRDASGPHQADALGVYAMALAITGDRRAVRFATDGLGIALREDERTVALLRSRMAGTCLHLSRLDEAEHHASDGAAIAEARQDWRTYGLCQSILASVCSIRGDVQNTIKHARLQCIGARKCGDRQLYLHGRRTEYAGAVDCGDDDAIGALEAELGSAPTGPADELLGWIGRSLQDCRKAEFAQAARRMESAFQNGAQPSEARFRRAFIAMCFAALGDRAAAIKYITEAGAAIKGANEMSINYATQSQLYLALADVLIGRPSLALRRLPKSPKSRFDAALGEAIASLANMGQSLSQPGVSQTLERLRSLGYGGFADIFRAALAGKVSRDAPKITRAEAEVLRLLASGLTPKEIAVQSGRRVSTVRSHLDSSRAKLGASGSRETILAAQVAGIISG